MQIIPSKTFDQGISDLAQCLIGYLNSGKKVLWLVSGGSNIPISVKVMEAVRKSVDDTSLLSSLTVSLMDERYGPAGHADSNWQQLKDSRFNLAIIQTIPVLQNLPLEETASQFSQSIEEAIDIADVVIGQFGIGPDGHTAGILPNTPSVNDENAVSFYTTKTYIRITLTPWTLRRINAAYTFAFGESKREAVRYLVERKLTLNEQPAQILKEIPESFLYSDLV